MMTARIYAFFFLFFLLLLFPAIIIAFTPYGNLPENDIRLWITAGTAYSINIICLVLVWRNNKTSEITFWEGLSIISSTLMSGCANITILYIFPVLLITYFILLANTIIGFFKGKEYTQAKWAGVVNWFVKHSSR